MHKMRKILYFVGSICRLPFPSTSATASVWFSPTQQQQHQQNELALVFGVVIVVVGFSISSRLGFVFDFGLEYFGLASEGQCQRVSCGEGKGKVACTCVA